MSKSRATVSSWPYTDRKTTGTSAKALYAEARRRLREMSAAPARSECERVRDEYVVDLIADGRIDAAETLVRG